MSKDARTIQEELSRPFAPEDLEWRIQQAFEDKGCAIAVPYVTNRAIQERLDEVVGPDNWSNEYRPWHGNGKKEAQICGISIYFEGRGWVTKWDGAEDTDIEAVKGGLSDSMKRCAVQWGIGRVLYKMNTVWVDIEKRGKSILIKESSRPKMDKAYTDLLRKLGLTPAKAGGVQSQLTPKPDAAAVQPAPKEQTPPPAPKAPPAQVPGNVTPMPRPQAPQWQYVVESVSSQRGMNQSTTTLMLKDAQGKTTKAFVKGTPEELFPGVQLGNVTLAVRKQSSVVYFVLERYEVVGYEAQAA